MGSADDWFWAYGNNWSNFIASGTAGGLGYTAVYASDSPIFSAGGAFQGWFYGVISFGGDPSPDGTTGPVVNDYSNFAGVLGSGTYVTGVAGISINNVGVYGQTEQDPNSSIPRVISAGVFGAANTGSGVVGWSTTWNGVEGWAYQGTAVLGVSDSGYGVQGGSTWQPGVLGASDNDTGVIGISGTEGPSVLNIPTTAGVVGSSDAQSGVIGTSNALIGVFGFSNNVGVVGQTTNPRSYAGFFNGNVTVVNGALTASVKNAVVPFPDGTQRLLHCMESPEHWFEDFGAAKLTGGRAVVKLDADFAKVIRSGDYRVFVTPEGDCRGLYVHRKSGDRFEVRELTGGKSSIAFSYRIVGRRKDIKEHRRFAKIDTRLPLPAEAARAPHKPAPTAAGLRTFGAGVQKELRERKPKSRRSRTSRKRSRPNFLHLMQRLPSHRRNQTPKSR